MDVVSLVGRLLVAWLFVASGVGNVVRVGQVSAHLRRRGVPNARRTSQVSGVAMVLIGVAMAAGAWLDVILIAAALLLVGIAVVMNPFWSKAGAERERMNVEFWKNVALAGALAVWLAYVIDTGDVPFGVTGPLL